MLQLVSVVFLSVKDLTHAISWRKDYMPDRWSAPIHLTKKWALWVACFHKLLATSCFRSWLPSLIYSNQSLIFNCTIALPIIYHFRLYHALQTSWYFSPAPSHAVFPTLPVILMTWCTWLLSLTSDCSRSPHCYLPQCAQTQRCLLFSPKFFSFLYQTCSCVLYSLWLAISDT